MSDRPHVLYPNHYAWLILVSVLDVFMTFVVISLGGWEANAVAASVIAKFGFVGLVVFKLAITCFAIFIAEQVGKRDEAKGRKFAEYAIVISAFPVIFGMTMVYLRS